MPNVRTGEQMAALEAKRREMSGVPKGPPRLPLSAQRQAIRKMLPVAGKKS